MAALQLTDKTKPDKARYEQYMRELAQDIVKNIYEVPDILQKFGITREEYDKLAETSAFKSMLQQSFTEWDASHNTPERVKLKSALLLERALPEMYGSLVDTKEPLSARTELFKAIGKIGGLGHSPGPGAGAASGSTFRLEINFPTQPARNIVIEHAALPSEVTPPASDFQDSLDVNDELL